MGQKCFKQYNSIDFFIDTKIFSCNNNAFDCTCHMYARACVLEDLPIFFYFKQEPQDILIKLSKFKLKYPVHILIFNNILRVF